MQLQVEQLEKEKKELNERMRVLSKRIDHIERAYRKEERPLLAKDYEIQQADDRSIFEETQKSRLEAHRQAHLHDLETKKRLTRMVSDFNQMKQTITSRRGEEFAKKQELAQRKMEEEKSKRRATILKAREEERLLREEEERIQREREEEEERLEAGMSSVYCVRVTGVHARIRAPRGRETSGGGRGSRSRSCRAEEARRGGEARGRAEAARRRASKGNGGCPPSATTRRRGHAETGRAQGSGRRRTRTRTRTFPSPCSYCRG